MNSLNFSSTVAGITTSSTVASETISSINVIRTNSNTNMIENTVNETAIDDGSVSISNNVTDPSNNISIERRCDRSSCNVVKMAKMVPKRKIAQFVSEPVVIDKPLLINGFNSIFVVNGSSAKLADIKNPSNGTPKSIYRILPNSHVHLVNYVIVDTNDTFVNKLKVNDPTAMLKLLSAQKQSAEQMLKKIMMGQGSTGIINADFSGPAQTSTCISNNIRMPISTSSLVTRPRLIGNNTTSIVASSIINGSTTMNTIQRSRPINSSIVQPIRSAIVRTSTPYITPVPLANLQSTPNSWRTSSSTIAGVSIGIESTLSAAPGITSTYSTKTDIVDKSTFNKMQAELQELRRTVARLAKAQEEQKLQKQIEKPQTQAGVSLRIIKRPRTTFT